MRGIIRENDPIFAPHRKKCNFDQNKKKIALLVQMGWGSKGAGGSAGAGQIFARSVNLTSQAHCVPAPSKNIKFQEILQTFTICHKKGLHLFYASIHVKKAEASICWSFLGQRSNIYCSWLDSNAILF